jgi:hypothetical protein
MIIRIRSRVATWRIEIAPDSTLRILKGIIHNKYQIPVESQIFSYDIEGSKPFTDDDDAQLSSCGLVHGDMLYLIERGANPVSSTPDSTVNAPTAAASTSADNSNRSSFSGSPQTYSGTPDLPHTNQNSLYRDENAGIAVDPMEYCYDDENDVPNQYYGDDNIRSPDKEKKMTLLGGDEDDENLYRDNPLFEVLKQMVRHYVVCKMI